MVLVLKPFLDVLPCFKECQIKFSVKMMSHNIAKFALRLTLGGLQRNYEKKKAAFQSNSNESFERNDLS